MLNREDIEHRISIISQKLNVILSIYNTNYGTVLLSDGQPFYLNPAANQNVKKFREERS